MQFGVFDHMDASGEPLAELFENRLKLAEAYDRLGLYALHVAEHHSTPLGMSPSPSVFLALAAQRTKRLRLGPLVYTLPLYHPLRLAEEICTLDHLSGGRLELGVGRGVSPLEIASFGVDPQQSQAMYLETYQVVMQALGSRSVRTGTVGVTAIFPPRSVSRGRRARAQRSCTRTSPATSPSNTRRATPPRYRPRSPQRL